MCLNQCNTDTDRGLSDRNLGRELNTHVDFSESTNELHVMPYKIMMPAHLELSDDEIMLLGQLQERIRTHSEVGG